MKSLTSRRVRALAVVTVAAAAGLAGCSAHPGMAAVVEFTDTDGVTHSSSVSEADLSIACEELQGVGAQCGQVLGVLESLPVYDYLAAKYGVTVSDDEIAQTLATINPDGTEVSEVTRNVMRFQVLGGKLSARENTDQIVQDFRQISSTASVEVSPRYRANKPWIVQPGQAGAQLVPSDQDGQGGQGSQDNPGNGTQDTDR